MIRQTLKETDHTHPFTGESFGAAMVYRRGPVIVADGGTATEDDRTASEHDRGSAAEEESSARLADIDHTPPYGDGVAHNRVYARGTERSDRV